MRLHGDACTCLHGRRLIVERVFEHGWTLAAAAEAAGVSVRTVSKGWLASVPGAGAVSPTARRCRCGCQAARLRSASR